MALLPPLLGVQNDLDRDDGWRSSVRLNGIGRLALDGGVAFLV
jgi:hypothetical protein